MATIRQCLALTLVLLAGCTQSVTFKVMDTSDGEPGRPLVGVKVSHGVFESNRDQTKEYFLPTDWKQWDEQTTGPDGVAAFRNVRKGREFLFTKEGYHATIWMPDLEGERDGAAFVIPMNRRNDSRLPNGPGTQ